MPIQIPEIQRFQPVDTPSVGRETVHVPDFAAATNPQERAASGLIEGVASKVQEQIKLRADTEGTNAANELHQYLENSLEGPDGAKRQKGDPTTIYKTFDENQTKKTQEILDRYKDASSETKQAVQLELQKTQAKFYDRKISAFGAQNETYQKVVTNNAVAIAKNDMMDATSHLDVTDPNTTVPIENVKNRIYDLRVKSGLKNGSVREIKNDQGVVTGYDMDPSVKLQIAKDTSESLKGAIENLNASGDVHGAQFLLEKYQGYLLADHKVKLEEHTKKATQEIEGQREFDAVRNLPPEKAMDRLDAIKDPEIRKKAMANLDTYQRQMQNSEKRSSLKNYQVAANQILQRQQSGEGFIGVNDMLKDPTIKRVWNNIKDPKQKLALEHMVDQPEKSDQNQLNDAYTKLFNGDFQGMRPEEFNQVVSGLNKADRKIFEVQYRKFNSQTPSQEVQMTKNMGSQLTKELNRLGFVKKNDFGKYNNKDQNKLTESYNELVQSLDKVGPLTPQEQSKWIQQFAADKVKGQAFNRGTVAPQRFQGQITTPTKPTTQNVSGVQVPASDIDRRRTAQQKFKKDNNRWPQDGAELDAYMKKNGL